MAARIVSVGSFGHDRVVKIAVPSYEALLKYKHEINDITIVVASDWCPEKDLKAIEAHCHELDYSYEGRLPAAAAAETSTKEDNAGAAAAETSTKGENAGAAAAGTSTKKDTAGAGSSAAGGIDKAQE